jgi:hypothetical protein
MADAAAEGPASVTGRFRAGMVAALREATYLSARDGAPVFDEAAKAAGISE